MSLTDEEIESVVPSTYGCGCLDEHWAVCKSCWKCMAKELIEKAKAKLRAEHEVETRFKVGDKVRKLGREINPLWVIAAANKIDGEDVYVLQDERYVDTLTWKNRHLELAVEES